jgi:NhaP-type Na+/H+ or K+/H+ antiporter
VTEQLLIALASILTLGIVAVWVAWRVHLPAILALLMAGLIAGPITGFLDPDAVFGELLFPLVSISVAIILFEGGTSLRLRELREIGRVVINLVTLGVLVSWVLGGALAYYLLDMTLDGAALLGAILVVTGPTVIVPLLRHVRPVHSVGYTLKWEGILIDPVGAMLAVLVFEAALAVGVQAATTVAVLGLLKTLLIGGLLANLGAGLLVLLMDRGWVPDFLQSPMALMVVVAAFAASNVLQPESGLITATLMGVLLANQKRVDVKHIIEFKENLQVLLIASLFVLLAARLKPADLTGLGVPEAVFLASLIVIVRPASVAISTFGSRLRWRERALISAIAPRGIVAAAVSSIFALELAHAGHAGADRLVSITFMVIIGTVVIYGLGAGPLARALNMAQPDPQGVMIVGAHPWARAIASELKDEGIAVRLIDTNYLNIAEARMAGLPVYYGSALTEGAFDRIETAGIGRLLALTSNDEVNSLTAVSFSEVFGRDSVFQLPPEQHARTGEAVLSRHLRGRFLFDPRATYWNLTAVFDAGADVKTTNLTETFDYQTFMDRYPDAIPLFLIGESGRLTVFTAKDPPEPGPGQRLVAVVATTGGPREPAADAAPS